MTSDSTETKNQNGGRVPSDLQGTDQSTSAHERDSEVEGPILFFDGVCGLCNHFVDFVLSHDKQGQFRLAPLQGETARNRISQEDVESLSTVVLVDEQGISRKSTAVVRVLRRLGFGWRLLGFLMWLIPHPLRDIGYRLVAANRYRLFGKKEACRMPTPDERSRFLD
jgi:predicted DCC family thiol-disulfide oxidoreductase YuxK